MLIKSASGALRLAHVSLAFAGLMWALPFLNYRHVAPISTFYQECGAAILGLCAMPLLATQRYWKQPEIPRIVLLPVGLSLLVWLQFAVGKVGYLDQALLVVLYLLWAAFLIMLGHRLREELGLPAMATVLAAFLLLGAELNALIGVFQHYFWCTHPDYLFLKYLRPSNFSGALGQANLFADYVTLGLVSLGLLYFRWRLRVWQVALLAAPLLFVLTLSGSRSPWLYLLCVAGMAFLWWRDKLGLPPAAAFRRTNHAENCARHQDAQTSSASSSTNFTPPLGGGELPGSAPHGLSLPEGVASAEPLALLYYSLLLLLGFGLIHFVVQSSWLGGCFDGLTSWERLVAGIGSGEGPRLHIWREAWLIFTQFPLMGAGFGQFAWQHFQLGPVLRIVSITGMADYAHNLVLQIAAEMGLSGLLILLGTLGLWLRQARTVQPTIYHWWGYGILTVLAIHSMLEYPLWYAHFLGVAALTFGMFDSTNYRLRLRGLGRLSVAAMLLLGLLSLAQMLYLYKNRNFDFEVMVRTLYASVTDNSYAQHARVRTIHDNMAAAQGHALLLRPYVESFLGEAGWDHVADKGALNERVMHYKPFNAVVYRHALLLARLGQQAEARVQMERAIWAYPEDFPAARNQLRALAGRDIDGRFFSLLEFALQKYEERQLAVQAKLR